MIKRIFLFLLTNILVMVTISILLSVLGINRGISVNGIDYGSLMAFCLVWGMAGSFISLQMSRWMAKKMMSIQLLEPNSGGEHDWLYNRVSQISQAAGLPKTPEIGVYESPEVNAFATGPSKSRSLVAFSTGLLQRMSKEEIEGVAAHEIAHIQNGDMVTMTLLQGVVNAFVMFLARVIGFFISQNVKEESRAMVQMIVVIVLDIALSILGSMVVFWFSRQREFKADAGSAKLVGRDKMIAALENLQRYQGLAHADEEHASLNTMKINGTGKGFARLFMSHPPLQERIAALSTIRA
jgi:heat shock protein HtpX